MMEDLLTVQEVLFFVDDMPQAKRWFTQLLGVEPHVDHPNYGAFRVAQVIVGLHGSDEKGHSGPNGQVVYWRVADLAKAVSHFQSNGCTLYRGPIMAIDKVEVCQLQDPFGNLWGLITMPQ